MRGSENNEKCFILYESPSKKEYFLWKCAKIEIKKRTK